VIAAEIDLSFDSIAAFLGHETRILPWELRCNLARRPKAVQLAKEDKYRAPLEGWLGVH
jgi:hypothetical protein